ncbi:hypothetical protein BC936DRAFT_138872 [Jimgerdemannia flammicorona]|uniref:Uncharacterized protein n=1 Tax=Jimgerdemannia flammicorona TaxID=994334 RepID=A0A433DI14_9FUNG|nr:hypothetical protein BC936DRAFT_138872 [Jimgerdemannia flammicorona]
MNHGVGLLLVMVAATNQYRYRFAAEQSLPPHPERGAADCSTQGAILHREGRRSDPGTRSVCHRQTIKELLRAGAQGHTGYYRDGDESKSDENGVHGVDGIFDNFGSVVNHIVGGGSSA